MKRRLVWSAVVLTVLGIALAASASPRVRALVAIDRGLVDLPADPRVRFEEGARNNATQVAAWLDDAMDRVEQRHGRAFAEPVAVVVTETQESFGRRVGMPRSNATGAVFVGRVVLSPRGFDEGRAEAILVHELSHAHLRQHRGTGSVVRGIPAWFQEGLAVWASGGGGAERVPVAEAVGALRDGRTFEPDADGTWTVPRDARSYGLQHHMFYRQAGMFVGYLAERDPEAFAAFLTDVLDGAEFERAFGNLGTSLDAAWSEFVASLSLPEAPR